MCLTAVDAVFMGASLGTGNRGVSALGASLVKLVRQGRPGVKVSMLLGRRSNSPFTLFEDGKALSVPVVNYRMSPRARFHEQLFVWFLLALLYRALPLPAWQSFLRARHPLIRASAEARLIGDIRGGDSFSDIYGLKNFLLGSLEVLAVILVRGDIVLFPQTYGPYKSFWARCVAAFILRRASVILSRDRESVSTVQHLIGQTRRCRFCPDVAFALDPRPPREAVLDPPLAAVGRGQLIGINVNGLMFNGGYTRDNMFGLQLDYRAFLARVIAQFLRDPEAHVALVPHTFAPAHSVESDPEACRQVRHQLPTELQSRVHLLQAEYDQSEIKAIIGQFHFFIGSRMHACIAALSQGIPAVGVAYSKKFRGVFDSVGVAEAVIDGRECSVEEALQRVNMLFEQREALREVLERRVREAKELLITTFKQLCDPSPAAVASIGDPVSSASPLEPAIHG